MKVVLDTNVLLSGILSGGLCEAILDACANRDDVNIFLSQFILDEFARHAAGKFAQDEEDVRGAIDYLKSEAELVIPLDIPLSACQDSDDLPILGTALAARADFLVTGDKDLLTLRQFEGIPILSPREFRIRLG